MDAQKCPLIGPLEKFNDVNQRVESGKESLVKIETKNLKQLQVFGVPKYYCNFYRNDTLYKKVAADFDDDTIQFSVLQCENVIFENSEKDWESSIGVKVEAVFDEKINYPFDSNDVFVTVFNCGSGQASFYEITNFKLVTSFLNLFLLKVPP